MKNTQVKHTPTPWATSEGGSKPYHSQLFFAGKYKEQYVGEVLTKNAQHIVKCVNVHDELVEALKRIHSYITCVDDYTDKSPLLEIIRQAINKAEGV